MASYSAQPPKDRVGRRIFFQNKNKNRNRNQNQHWRGQPQTPNQTVFPQPELAPQTPAYQNQTFPSPYSQPIFDSQYYNPNGQQQMQTTYCTPMPSLYGQPAQTPNHGHYYPPQQMQTPYYTQTPSSIYQLGQGQMHVAQQMPMTPGPNGQYGGAMYVGNDITERQFILEKLRLTNEMFNAMSTLGSQAHMPSSYHQTVLGVGSARQPIGEGQPTNEGERDVRSTQETSIGEKGGRKIPAKETKKKHTTSQALSKVEQDTPSQLSKHISGSEEDEISTARPEVKQRPPSASSNRAPEAKGEETNINNDPNNPFQKYIVSLKNETKTPASQPDILLNNAATMGIDWLAQHKGTTMILHGLFVNEGSMNEFKLHGYYSANTFLILRATTTIPEHCVVYLEDSQKLHTSDVTAKTTKFIAIHFHELPGEIGHWFLVNVDLNKNAVVCYDSLARLGNNSVTEIHRTAASRTCNTIVELLNLQALPKDIRLEDTSNSSMRQTDGTSCGPLTWREVERIFADGQLPHETIATIRSRHCQQVVDAMIAHAKTDPIPLNDELLRVDNIQQAPSIENPASKRKLESIAKEIRDTDAESSLELSADDFATSPTDVKRARALNSMVVRLVPGAEPQKEQGLAKTRSKRSVARKAYANTYSNEELRAMELDTGEIDCKEVEPSSYDSSIAPERKERKEESAGQASDDDCSLASNSLGKKKSNAGKQGVPKKRSRWLLREIETLAKWVELDLGSRRSAEHPDRFWSSLYDALPGRNGRPIYDKLRQMQSSSPPVSKPPWTVAEVELLNETCKNVDNTESETFWASVAKSLPNRTAEGCRSKYEAHLSLLAAHCFARSNLIPPCIVESVILRRGLGQTWKEIAQDTVGCTAKELRGFWRVWYKRQTESPGTDEWRNATAPIFRVLVPIKSYRTHRAVWLSSIGVASSYSVGLTNSPLRNGPDGNITTVVLANSQRVETPSTIEEMAVAGHSLAIIMPMGLVAVGNLPIKPSWSSIVSPQWSFENTDLRRFPGPWVELLDALRLLELAGLVTEEVTNFLKWNMNEKNQVGVRPSRGVIAPFQDDAGLYMCSLCTNGYDNPKDYYCHARLHCHGGHLLSTCCNNQFTFTGILYAHYEAHPHCNTISTSAHLEHGTYWKIFETLKYLPSQSTWEMESVDHSWQCVMVSVRYSGGTGIEGWQSKVDQLRVTYESAYEPKVTQWFPLPPKKIGLSSRHPLWTRPCQLWSPTLHSRWPYEDTMIQIREKYNTPGARILILCLSLSGFTSNLQWLIRVQDDFFPAEITLGFAKGLDGVTHEVYNEKKSDMLWSFYHLPKLVEVMKGSQDDTRYHRLVTLLYLVQKEKQRYIGTGHVPELLLTFL
ncbi:MAG: hypothetical protein Q9180_000766 [Flavoplaca navasiana]